MDVQGLKSSECLVSFKDNKVDVAWRNNKANYLEGEKKLSINLFIDCLCYFKGKDSGEQECNEKLFYLNTCRHPGDYSNYYDYADQDDDGTYFYKRYSFHSLC